MSLKVFPPLPPSFSAVSGLPAARSYLERLWYARRQLETSIPFSSVVNAIDPFSHTAIVNEEDYSNYLWHLAAYQVYSQKPTPPPKICTVTRTETVPAPVNKFLIVVSIFLAVVLVFSIALRPQAASSPVSGTQVESNAASQTVYITLTGSKYHRSNCSYLSSKISISLKDAKSQGYTACSRCNP